jgi:hypothetical protein
MKDTSGSLAARRNQRQPRKHQRQPRRKLRQAGEERGGGRDTCNSKGEGRTTSNSKRRPEPGQPYPTPAQEDSQPARERKPKEATPKTQEKILQGGRTQKPN